MKHQENRIQAEIAGGSMTSPREWPRKGQFLRSFELLSSRSRTIRLSDYRGAAGLVLILSDERPETEELMREAGRQYPEIRKKDAEVLAIVHGSQGQASAVEQRLNLPYPVLLDQHGRLHMELGATDAQNHDAAAVYVTDRFGEVFALYRTAEGDVLPGIGEILKQFEFISFQCPECEPPEWPA